MPRTNEFSDAEAQYAAFEHAAWERAATAYAESFASVTAPFIVPLLDAIQCRAAEDVLDVATGIGHIAATIAAEGAKPIGVDFSAAMIAEAKRRAPVLRFECGDAQALPFDAASFDAVVIGFGVRHFPNPRAALTDARRVLRARGRLAFSIWAHENKFQQVLQDAIRASGARDAALPPAPHGELRTTEHCVELLRASGFDAEGCTAAVVERTIPVPTPQRLIDITLRGTARGAAMVRAQPADRFPAILAHLERAMAPYRRADADGYAVPAAAIIAAARR